uniref:Uncharacterized protein n=1 Tax=Panagrolaimus sp. PS1159 TaxID=55785 RepID=A0AC35F6C8_9BILA
MKKEWFFLEFLLIGLILNGEAAPSKPGNPFGDRSEEKESESAEYIDEKPSQRGTATAPKSSPKSDENEYYEEDDEPSTRPPIIIPKVTPSPIRENIMYTILPTLQKKTIKYCAYNQYTFMTTCRPGKKLRYDLQVFCQEYADYCGVPNIHLYPSRTPQPEYRPAGYGQKQQNGHLGMGRSLGFGLGVIPGFEIVGSRGADIGNIPGLQVGGLMFNSGTDIGVLGERVGKGPARSIGALAAGYPSFGLDPNTKSADSRASNAALRALGIPPVPGLAKIFGNLQAPGLKKKKGKILFEPGYDAVDKNAPIATGRTDGESVNLPATLGKIEILDGVGMGIGKK